MNAIQLLEELKGMITYDKSSILLVHGKLKPAAQVVMQGPIFSLDSEVEHIPNESISTLHEVLTFFKLAYVSKTVVMENSSDASFEHGQEVMRISIAQDNDVAIRLRDLFTDVSNNHTAIGHLLGYPSTAVEAFLTAQMLEWGDYPKSTEHVSEKNMRLLGHRLSRKNWEEEVNYLETSGEYLKSISPKIYGYITREE